MWVLMVLVAVALVIGPFMALRPSKQERDQARLRAEAAKLGLWVRASTSLPANETFTLPNNSFAYVLALSPALDIPSGLYKVNVENKEWFCSEGEASSVLLEALVEQRWRSGELLVGATGLGILWAEGGETRDVQNIASLLRNLCVIAEQNFAERNI